MFVDLVITHFYISVAQGHFIQADCENLVSPPLDGLIRWESVERRTGENVDESG